MTVVVVFESDGYGGLCVNAWRSLLQLQSMVEQCGQCGIELTQGRFCQGFAVYLFEDFLAAFEHFGLQIELESIEMPFLSLVIFGAEAYFGCPPAFQCFGRDFQQVAGHFEIAVVLIELIEGCNFFVERIASCHWICVLPSS